VGEGGAGAAGEYRGLQVKHGRGAIYALTQCIFPACLLSECRVLGDRDFEEAGGRSVYVYHICASFC